MPLDPNLGSLGLLALAVLGGTLAGVRIGRRIRAWRETSDASGSTGTGVGQRTVDEPGPRLAAGRQHTADRRRQATMTAVAGVALVLVGVVVVANRPRDRSEAVLGATAASSQATAAPTLTPTPSPAPTSTDTPSPPPSPTPTPSPEPTPSPTPTAPNALAALLTPCPDQPGCSIYIVRKGDTLTSIGLKFGVPLATIYALNPKYTQGFRLLPGARIRLPITTT